MELTHDDVKKILEIIDSAEHLQEVDLAYGGFHLRVQRGGGNAGGPTRESRAPVPRPASQPALPSEAPSPSGAGSGAVSQPRAVSRSAAC